MHVERWVITLVFAIIIVACIVGSFESKRQQDEIEMLEKKLEECDAGR